MSTEEQSLSSEVEDSLELNLGQTEASRTRRGSHAININFKEVCYC